MSGIKWKYNIKDEELCISATMLNILIDLLVNHWTTLFEFKVFYCRDLMESLVSSDQYADSSHSDVQPLSDNTQGDYLDIGN